MTAKSIKKILIPAVILPLTFTAVVFIAAYIAVSPYLSMITSALNLISTPEPPSFKSELESVFVKRSADNPPPEETTAESEELPAETETESLTLNMIEVADIIMPKYEQHYANLTIPALEVDCKLFYGDSDAVLKEGAGQYIGTRMPGFGTPILIGAHNTSYFKAFEWIEAGQTVIIETGYGTFEYEIYETRVAPYYDETAYDLTLEEEILMLYTCYPFGSLGYKDDRLFVYGKKISGPVVNW